MAMDKDRLLAYFQQHYLSRQEVLFKLPLNISIDTFWPELLNRRKAGAVILPLCNAAGMPYWYVLTDKMVKASERLCEEAMAQEEGFDPYRAQMTSAMTEEMFFTSFVEGAQIPLQEAMDFLQRGTEPENIQEQMIWNNRRAWSGMISSLFRPLDEQFVKSLAFMLTEEMDNCAEDYRQTDTHPIAAMNSEPYDVPSAFTLPDRMKEYYDFLLKGDVHPLIKAAVGQAFILVTRPFPEGNERLSRMISSAVLLRSGYDFFRDISISSVIAKENYRYYKCMQEIIRSENGGDMTYFVEYFLELLIRSMDVKKERDQRREQEALAREREMAREPLRAPVPNPSPPEAAKEAKEAEMPDLPRGAEPWPFQPLETFLDQVGKLKHSPKSAHREYPQKVKRMIDRGLMTFTVSQWGEIQGIGRKDADYECRVLYQKGMVDRHTGEGPMQYSFRIAGEPTGDAEEESTAEELAEIVEPNESPPVLPEAFAAKLALLDRSRSDMKHRTAETIRSLLARGIDTFSRAEWRKYTGLRKEHANDSCDVMVSMRIVKNTSSHSMLAVYKFNLDEEEVAMEQANSMTAVLRSMTREDSSARDQRIGTFLLEHILKGINRFTTMEWGARFNISKTMYGADIRRSVNLGLTQKILVHDEESGYHYEYEICKKVQTGIRTDDLTVTQKEYLSMLYDQYAEAEFSVEDMAKLMPASGATAQFHLSNFTERGILNQHRRPGKACLYVFAVTSADHPECFTQIGGPSTPTEKQKRKSETAMITANAGKVSAASA